MTTPLTRTFPVQGPLDLRATLTLQHMWGATPWLRVDDSGAWYAQRMSTGTATIRLAKTDDGLFVQAWGHGAEELMETVPALMGLDNIGLAALEPHSDRMRAIRQAKLGYRSGRTGRVLPQLVSAALSQKVTTKNGKGSMRRIVRAWGERAPGPRDDIGLLPVPRQLERPYFEYSRLGVEKHRADLVRRIASRATALQRAAKMPFAEGRAHLEKLPGIGPWTSGVVMGGPLGDPDAFPIGDYHLPNFVSWTLAREPRGNESRMAELLEPYAGLRGMVARAVKTGGDGAPRYGPKATVQDLRDLGE